MQRSQVRLLSSAPLLLKGTPFFVTYLQNFITDINTGKWSGVHPWRKDYDTNARHILDCSEFLSYIFVQSGGWKSLDEVMRFKRLYIPQFDRLYSSNFYSFFKVVESGKWKSKNFKIINNVYDLKFGDIIVIRPTSEKAGHCVIVATEKLNQDSNIFKIPVLQSTSSQEYIGVHNMQCHVTGVKIEKLYHDKFDINPEILKPQKIIMARVSQR